MVFQPLQTADGSWTLRYPDRPVAFRSTQGALSESRHVFLKGSHLEIHPPPWTVLELGLGTGLNFLVTASAFGQLNTSAILDYHVIEMAPQPPEILPALHYQEIFGTHPALALLTQVLTQAQTCSHPFTLSAQNISLTLYPSDWQRVHLPPIQALAIYHDPFGPRDNPEAWSAEYFAWIRPHLAPNGCLVTYAAATHIRRAMTQAGFTIASLPGSGHKREMTLAAQSPDALTHAKLLTQARFFA